MNQAIGMIWILLFWSAMATISIVAVVVSCRSTDSGDEEAVSRTRAALPKVGARQDSVSPLLTGISNGAKAASTIDAGAAGAVIVSVNSSCD